MARVATGSASAGHLSLDDYLKLDDASDVRFEYRGGTAAPLSGRVVAMAGGSEYHDLVGENVRGELRARLKDGPCRSHGPDFRIGVAEYPTFTYADGFVICGPTE